MKTVRLITCPDAVQAHIIRGALENEGISSLLHNENISTVMRGYTSEITGVDVLVYEEDFDRAADLLERNQMIPEQLKYCPCCGASDIKFVLREKNRIRAIVAAILSMLAAAPPGTDHWEYICRKCGAHFEKPVARQKEGLDKE